MRLRSWCGVSAMQSGTPGALTVLCFTAQRCPSCLYNSFRRQTILFHHAIRSSRLCVRFESNVLHDAGSFLGNDLRDADTQASLLQMLLRDHDGFGLPSRTTNGLAVERLDRVHVYDT